MERKSEVVIIGGGIVGVSIAFNLAKQGLKDIIILEKENLPGMGSTAKCIGGIRQQFSSEINIRLSQESVKIFENFAKEMVAKPVYDVRFKQNGYLFLIRNNREIMTRFLDVMRFQEKLNVPIEIWSQTILKEKFPYLNLKDLAFGIYCGKDGTLDPYSFHQEYLRQAKIMGVKLFTEEEAVAVEKDGWKIKKVITAKREIETQFVVNAAGPWAKKIGQMAGIDLPLTLHHQSILITGPLEELPREQPLIFEPGQNGSFYFKTESNQRLLFGGHKKIKIVEDPDRYELINNPEFFPFIAQKAQHRLKFKQEFRVAREGVGLYTVTPDNHPILGKVPGLEGFILAVGFSGHGFMHAPAVGKLISELIVCDKTSEDISSLSLAAFKTGKRPKESYVV